MALKFNCKSCGEAIATKFLKPGEFAKCHSCGDKTAVPDDALKVPDGGISPKVVLQDFLPQPTKVKVVVRSGKDIWLYRILGLNFVGGGTLGIISIIEATFTGQFSPFSIIFVIPAIGFFIWNVILGVFLLERHERSLNWARITLVFLIPQFFSPVITYSLSSGAAVKFLVQLTGEFGLFFKWNFAGTFQFGIGYSDSPVALGINFVAALLFVAISMLINLGSDSENLKSP